MSINADVVPDPAARARALFLERSFVDPEEDVPPEPTFTAEHVEAARRTAFDEGRFAGRQEENDSQHSRLNALLEEINVRLEGLQKEVDVLDRQRHDEAKALALALARKLFPIWAERHGLEEVEGLVTTAMGDLGEEPRFTVRVAEARVDEAQKVLLNLATLHAYPGTLIVRGDSGLGLSECRVEWADGGMERREQLILERLENVVVRAQQPPTRA